MHWVIDVMQMIQHQWFDSLYHTAKWFVRRPVMESAELPSLWLSHVCSCSNWLARQNSKCLNNFSGLKEYSLAFGWSLRVPEKVPKANCLRTEKVYRFDSTEIVNHTKAKIGRSCYRHPQRFAKQISIPLYTPKLGTQNHISHCLKRKPSSSSV